ncbi:MAG: HAMP domain-containing sensor histidine kinase [Halioglobus sp.]
MHPAEVLNSLTFRYIAKYVAVLSASVFLVLGAFYVYFSYTSFRDLGLSVLGELETLSAVYSSEALEGVERYIDAQNAVPAVHRFYYLVSDAEGNPVAGNLPPAPRYSEFDDGWLGFEMALLDWGDPVDVDFLARPIALGDDYEAIVARSYADIVDRARLVFSNLLRAMLATLLLGIIGGYFSAARALNRVERINRDLARVIRGNPGQRLDVTGEKGYVRALVLLMNEMLEQMESLMQGVRRVSDNIAHDLRTPLTRIRNDLTQLRDQPQPAARQELARVIEECDDLLAAFSASLRISTLESGSRFAAATQVELQRLLADVVELYEPLAQKRGIRITLDSTGELQCPGESDLLFQMFANVVDNAVKYTPDNGAICVRLRRDAEGDCLVVISDNGPGIAASERSNVFRRFYRVEASRSEFPGHGLGLSLVQAIAQFHHGSVELGSANPGLQVRVRLPADFSLPRSDGL